MDLKEYREKVSNIKETHPAPEGMQFPETNFYYRAIIKDWQKELSAKDRRTVEAEERTTARKMAS